MSRTQQQQEAITLALDPTNHLIKIQACAGAGKTHTLIELVKELKPTTGLYLAYNKAIATEATAKFKGTNVKDALDASLAILERFSTKQDCLFMFSSHLIELSDEITVTQQIDCRYFEADESEGKLRFDYLLRSGVSSQRLGMRVLREEGVFDLLDD